MASKLSLLQGRLVGCRLCPRLVEHRESVARRKRRAYKDQSYWGKPVPAFGRADASIVILGLAPGAHGANRTGRCFTGDSAGDFLFAALHRAGLASSPVSTDANDNMVLHEVFLTNALKCCPPDNRPSRQELDHCRSYLLEELRILRKARVYLCLGKQAFDQFQDAIGERIGRFGHSVCCSYEDKYVVCSYHVSRQNTQTGRLTPAMFDEVVAICMRLAGVNPAEPHLLMPPEGLSPEPPKLPDQRTADS